MSDMLAHLLGRYALFLEMVRGRYDLAERYYRRALTVAPEHIPNRGRFAVFLEMVRSDHGRAEALYERVLEVAPNHRNGLFKCATSSPMCATTTTGPKSSTAGASRSPDNPAMLTNFAAGLLLEGKEGMTALADALRHPSLQQRCADAAECWFYAVVHGAAEGRPTALRASGRFL